MVGMVEVMETRRRPGRWGWREQGRRRCKGYGRGSWRLL